MIRPTLLLALFTVASATAVAQQQPPAPAPEVPAQAPPPPAAQRAYSSVLVLPFASADGGSDWIGRGIREDLATELVRQSRLAVLTYGGVGPAEDAEAAARIGREHHASLVAYGTFQIIDQEVRISGRLIDAEDARQIAALKATGPRRDLFHMEDLLATQAVAGLPPGSVQTVGPAPALPAEPNNLVPDEPLARQQQQSPAAQADDDYYSNRAYSAPAYSTYGYSDYSPYTYGYSSPYYSYSTPYYDYGYPSYGYGYNYGYPYYGYPYYGGLYLGFGGFFHGHDRDGDRGRDRDRGREGWGGRGEGRERWSGRGDGFQSRGSAGRSSFGATGGFRSSSGFSTNGGFHSAGGGGFRSAGGGMHSGGFSGGHAGAGGHR